MTGELRSDSPDLDLLVWPKGPEGAAEEGLRWVHSQVAIQASGGCLQSQPSVLLGPGWNAVRMAYPSRFEHPKVLAIKVWNGEQNRYRDLSRGTRLVKDQVYWVRLDDKLGVGLSREELFSRVGALDNREHPSSLVSLPPGPSRISAPHGLQAVFQNGTVRLGWKPSKNGLGVGGRAQKSVFRTRVYRNGEPIALVSTDVYEDVPPVKGVVQYAVTTVVESEEGIQQESLRSEGLRVDVAQETRVPSWGAFGPSYLAAEGRSAMALPQIAVSALQGTLMVHAVFLEAGRGHVTDRIWYLRSAKAGQQGSWSIPRVVAKAQPGMGLNHLTLAARGAAVAIGWMDAPLAPSSDDTVAHRVQVLESHDAGEGWIRANDFDGVPAQVRKSLTWTRGLSMAYGVGGALHFAWGEGNKTYYQEGLQGDPVNVFDRTHRSEDERVYYLAQIPRNEQSTCACPECWCEESYSRSRPSWTDERVVRMPSLHVDEHHVTLVARQIRRWDNQAVPNPLWAAMLANPIYDQKVLLQDRPTRYVVGWQAVWKRAYEPEDEAELFALGHTYQYLYEGRWDERDQILVARRPLEGRSGDSGRSVGDPAGSRAQAAEWVFSTVDTIADAGLNDGVSHPQVWTAPGGRVYVAYERGPSADPNAWPGNVVALSYSDDGAKTWSLPTEVSAGYMPRLAGSEHVLQILTYVPEVSKDGQGGTPSGVIRVARRTADGRVLHQTIGEVVQPIHWKTHGPKADRLGGVPALVGYKDLFLAAWIRRAELPSRGEGLMMARATSLLESEVVPRVDLSPLGPVRSGRATQFRLRIENQYHMATAGRLGPVALPDASGRSLKVGPWSAPELPEATGTNLKAELLPPLGESGVSGAAMVWASVNALDGEATLQVSTTDEGLNTSVRVPVGRSDASGNYERAVTLRDRLYNAEIGVQREFVKDTSNSDTEHLAAFERVWVYTQAIALAQAVRQDARARARQLAGWLCDHAVWDHASSPPSILGWNFSQNTKNDGWKDVRLVTGASAWAVHALGQFVASKAYALGEASDAGSEGRRPLLECYQASFRGMLQNFGEGGLVGAGLSVPSLTHKGTGTEYYRELDDLGYEVAPERVRVTHVVAEHNLDVLAVLNAALKHPELSGLPAAKIRTQRDRLRNAIFELLWDPDQNRFITGGDFNREGEFQKSPFSAVDNCSWLSLSVDYATLGDKRQSKLAACLHYTVRAFVKKLSFTDDPHEKQYLGTHYFPWDFRDPYIDLAPEDQAKQPKSYHLEATAGVILGLWRFAEQSDHPDASYFRDVGNTLWSEMQTFVVDHGFVYSSRRIQNLSTRLESSTAAIWFIDVQDASLQRPGFSDRPLKRYARVVDPEAKEGDGDGHGSRIQPLAWAPGNAMVPAVVSRTEVEAVLIQARRALTLGQDREEPDVADPGIWAPRPMVDLSHHTDYHNPGHPHIGFLDRDIDLPEAWSIVSDPGEVVVAVIDTGVKLDDDRLRFWTNPGETEDGVDNDGNGYRDDIHGWDVVDNDPDPDDENVELHGTQVAVRLAGIAEPGGQFVGVAPGARVMPVRAFSSGGGSDTAGVVAAIDYVVKMKARFNRGEGGADVRVINLSAGSNLNPFSWDILFWPDLFLRLQGALSRAADEGILVVGGTANMTGVISLPGELEADNFVAALGTTADDAVAEGSMRGPRIEIAAPSYHRVDADVVQLGNSFAAPLVSGTALLAWQVAPDASPKEIRQAILDGVDLLPGLQDATSSGGRLNVFRTLQHLRLMAPLESSDELRRQSSIEDKIETQDAKVRYILRLPPHLRLRVTVEPLWLDAATRPTLWPVLERVRPNGDSRTVHADAVGAPIVIGPEATVQKGRDRAHQFIISGRDGTTGPFRLRVALSKAAEVLTSSPGPSLDALAAEALAWTAQGDLAAATEAVSAILAASPFGDESRDLADATLAAYALGVFLERFGVDGDRIHVTRALFRGLPDLVERLSAGGEAADETRTQVYAVFLFDAAIRIWTRVYPDTVRIWEGLRQRLEASLLGSHWDEERHLPFFSASSEGDAQEGERTDAVVYGLFLIARGQLARARALLMAVADKDPSSWPHRDEAESWADTDGALLLLWRAAGAFDPRFEQVALTGFAEGLAGGDPSGLAPATLLLAHQPAGVWGVHVGPNVWVEGGGPPGVDEDPRPDLRSGADRQGGVPWAQWEARLRARAAEAWLGLLVSGPEGHHFDYWFRRLHEVRIATAEVGARRPVRSWLSTYEQQDFARGIEDTVSLLGAPCSGPSLTAFGFENLGADALESVLGVSCGLFGRVFQERLAGRVGSSPTLLGLVMDNEAPVWSFAELVRSVTEARPELTSSEGAEPGFRLGNVDAAFQEGPESRYPGTWRLLASRCRLEGGPELCPSTNRLSSQATPDELRVALVARFEAALDEGLKAWLEGKNRSVVYQLYGTDGLEALNPGAPVYGDRKNMELRFLLQHDVPVDWRFWEAPVDVRGLRLDEARAKNVRWMRRLINEKAGGHLAQVAMRLRSTTVSLHRWMLFGEIDEAEFEALKAHYLLGDEAQDWQGRFHLSPSPAQDAKSLPSDPPMDGHTLVSGEGDLSVLDAEAERIVPHQERLQLAGVHHAVKPACGPFGLILRDPRSGKELLAMDENGPRDVDISLLLPRLRDALLADDLEDHRGSAPETIEVLTAEGVGLGTVGVLVEPRPDGSGHADMRLRFRLPRDTAPHCDLPAVFAVLGNALPSVNLNDPLGSENELVAQRFFTVDLTPSIIGVATGVAGAAHFYYTIESLVASSPDPESHPLYGTADLIATVFIMVGVVSGFAGSTLTAIAPRYVGWASTAVVMSAAWYAIWTLIENKYGDRGFDRGVRSVGVHDDGSTHGTIVLDEKYIELTTKVSLYDNPLHFEFEPWFNLAPEWEAEAH